MTSPDSPHPEPPGALLRALRHDRKAGLLFWGALAAPPLLLFVFTALLPGLHLVRALTQAASPDSLTAPYASPSVADSLRRQAAYLQARLALAEQDVIGLSIDLADSVLQLEVRGVPLRRCPVRDYRAGRALARLTTLETRILPALFTLEQATATIPREPIRVVKAPKDTVEAAARPASLLPVETRDVRFILRFAPDLMLVVTQPPSSFSEKVRAAVFDAKVRLAEAGRAGSALLQGRLPVHMQHITLELSGEDARAVYQALPSEAKLALRTG